MNLCGRRKKTVRQESGPKASPACWGCHSDPKQGHSHLQYFASHCPNHMLQTLQNSYPTTVVQQMGCYRDDLKERKWQSCQQRFKFQIFSQFCLTYPKSLQPWISTFRIKNKKTVGECRTFKSSILTPSHILSAQSSKTLFQSRRQFLLAPHIPCLSRRAETARSGGGVTWGTQS